MDEDCVIWCFSVSHTHPCFSVADAITHARSCTHSWTTWLISAIESRNRAERTLSCIPDEMDERFHQPNGSVLLVRGHVLQVIKTANDSMGKQRSFA